MDGIEEKSAFDWRQWLLIGLLVLAGLAIVGGGIFVYQKALSKKGIPPEISLITPTPAEEALPTEEVSEATPTPSLARTDLKIKILNGSGVTGEAGKAAQFLEKLGYKDIKTGNADKFDYEKTIIEIKESKKDYLKQLRTDLSSKYALAEETKILTEDDKFDVLVILGKEVAI